MELIFPWLLGLLLAFWILDILYPQKWNYNVSERRNVEE
jgi:hypothetical protein